MAFGCIPDVLSSSPHIATEAAGSCWALTHSHSWAALPSHCLFSSSFFFFVRGLLKCILILLFLLAHVMFPQHSGCFGLSIPVSSEFLSLGPVANNLINHCQFWHRGILCHQGSKGSVKPTMLFLSSAPSQTKLLDVTSHHKTKGSK